LEIRGAGNILGTEQSGHISAVGYEFYCELLEKTVRRLKKLPPKVVVNVNVDLPGEAYLPRRYVSDMRLKIDLYRRLARVTTFEELNDLTAELVDRFGPPPREVERLLGLAELRLLALGWMIGSIHLEDGYAVFGYQSRPRIEQLAKRRGGKLRVVDDRSAYLPLAKGLTNPDSIFAVIKALLQPD
jgi:transcription-repair coupling factor (superfamily II helicase)